MRGVRILMCALVVVAMIDGGAQGVCTGLIFSDVSTASVTAEVCDSIERMWMNGTTRGCAQDDRSTPQNEAMYCPDALTTRPQIAAFIIRALEGEPPEDYCVSGSPFGDVPKTAPFCKYIKRMSEVGFTKGCNPPENTRYCPAEVVKRRQLAAFIIRALEGEPPEDYCVSGSPFGDVPKTDPFCKYIKRMSELGLLQGCDSKVPGASGKGAFFCPGKPVTRAETAMSISLAFLRWNATLGDDAFSGTPAFFAGNNPRCGISGDFNNDGLIDVGVVGGMGIFAFLNSERGFKKPVVHLMKDGPVSAAVGDFDKDGYLDLATVNFFDGTTTVLQGRGDGHFQELAKVPVGGNPACIVTGLFNGDSVLDLATANPGDHRISILLGNDDGTFRSVRTIDTGLHPLHLALGDFNGDGVTDIAAANVENYVAILLGDGTGVFSYSFFYPTDEMPTFMAVGDFDNDGHADIALSQTASHSIAVLRGRGDGTLTSACSFEVGTGFRPESLVAKDFNNDGYLDIGVGNYGISSDTPGGNGISVFLGFGGCRFVKAEDVITGVGTTFLLAEDFSADNYLDIVAVNENSSNITLLAGKGDGTFGPHGSYPAGSAPHSVTLGDFNNDGILDLVTANLSGAKIPVLYGVGDGSFRGPASIELGTNTHAVAVGDFNNDGNHDLVTGDFGGESVIVILGHGDGTFAEPRRLYVGPMPTEARIGDFNGDGNEDLAVAVYGSDYVLILLGDGTGGLSYRHILSERTSRPNSVAAGDLNEDGKEDLAVAYIENTFISIYRGNGDGTFSFTRNYEVGDGPHSVKIADLNGDGDPDLIGANTWSRDVYVLLNRGDGTFGTVRRFPTGEFPSFIGIADFDGDGYEDFAVTNEFSYTVSVYMGRGDGSFDFGHDFVAGARPMDVAVGDFNMDGRPDLAVPNWYTNDVTVMLNAFPVPTGAPKRHGDPGIGQEKSFLPGAR